MKYAPLVVVALLAVVSADERYTMTGVVLNVDPSARTMVVSTDKVPGLMDAMAMPFSVLQTTLLNGLKPGTTIEFTYVVDKGASHAENIRVRGFESLEQKPLELRRLKLLNGLASPELRAGVLAVGQRVPEFVLTDQSRQHHAFSNLAGKVVAVTFTYIRCPNPAYCFRLASNYLQQLQKQFKDRLGRDLVFLTIVIDPEHDQKGALAEYARTWTTDANVWHFLHGPPARNQTHVAHVRRRLLGG